MHPAFEGLAALPFYDEFDLSTVDVLLISQYVLPLCQRWRQGMGLPQALWDAYISPGQRMHVPYLLASARSYTMLSPALRLVYENQSKLYLLHVMASPGDVRSLRGSHLRIRVHSIPTPSSAALISTSCTVLFLHPNLKQQY
jgi:hypothetical protein